MTAALPIVYLNGEFLPLEEARISPLDRGFLFGDAAYEVIPVYGGRPFLLAAHLQRLHQSLRELRIDNPLAASDYPKLVETLVARNGGGDLGIYIQVTRGAARAREHTFPPDVEPTVFAMANPAPAETAAGGIKAITLPDHRWGRCDIKATALLANVLARQAARDAGTDDAILLWDGEVTEAAASSVIIVEDGELVRRANGPEILPGTTTDFVVSLAESAGLRCRQEPISAKRLRAANEIWLTSAMRGIAPVIELDGQPVGDGRPGPVFGRIYPLFEASKVG